MVSFGSASEALFDADELRRSSDDGASVDGLRLMIQAVPLQESVIVSPEMAKPSGTGKPLQRSVRRSCANVAVLSRQSSGSSEARSMFMIVLSRKGCDRIAVERFGVSRTLRCN